MLSNYHHHWCYYKLTVIFLIEIQDKQIEFLKLYILVEHNVQIL